MSGQSASPALSDDELRETLDRLAGLTLTMSDQVEDQTKAINRVTTAANEARRAATIAQNQTDPEHYGELVGETIDGKIRETLNSIVQSVNELDQKTNQTVGVLAQAEKDKWDVINAIRAREVKVERFKGRLPWFGLGAVVLALAMAVLLPRFSAINGATCAVFGGQWLNASTGGFACVHYQD